MPGENMRTLLRVCCEGENEKTMTCEPDPSPRVFADPDMVHAWSNVVVDPSVGMRVTGPFSRDGRSTVTKELIGGPAK